MKNYWSNYQSARQLNAAGRIFLTIVCHWMWVFSIIGFIPANAQTGPDSQQRLQERELASLIGGIYRDDRFVDRDDHGWKQVGGTLLNSCTNDRVNTRAVFKKGPHYAVGIGSIAKQQKPGESVVAKLLGIQYVGKQYPSDTAPWFTFTCEGDHVPDLKDRKPGCQFVMARADFDLPNCKRYSIKKHEAWHVDVNTGNITPVATKDLLCEFRYDLASSEGPAGHCPAYRK